MRRHRLPWPVRALLCRRFVTHGEDEIELRRIWRGKFTPALASQIVGGNMYFSQQPQRERIHLTLRVAPCAECTEPPASDREMICGRLSENRSRRIARAKK